MDTQDYLLFLTSFIFFLLGCFFSYLLVRFRRRYDGEIEVVEDAVGVKTFSISLDDEDPWNLDRKKRVVFKIKSTSELS